MSSGSDVVAGPDVDMAELDAASSGPHAAVDLDLNLGPSFALELAIGGQDFEELAPVSRPNWNWPRFEPGILAGGQEDDVPPMAEDVPAEVQVESGAGVLSVLSPFNAGSSSFGNEGGLDQIRREPDTPLQRSVANVLRFLRNGMSQPRQVPPIQDLLQTQDSSEYESALETRTATASDTAVSLLLPRTSGNNETTYTAFDVDPSLELSNQNGRLEAGAVLGAGFECNVCLDMATEPVVTCCGHLFCWSCLYKWLHLHSSQKECPVCKGFLSDDAITPIYGRDTGQAAEKISGSIPPRPHAHRVNGKRSQLDRLFGDRLDRGAATEETQVPGETSNAAELVLSRLRIAQRLQREHIDDRFRMRLHQRLMGRRVRGGLRPRALTALGIPAQASSASPTPSSDEHHAEDVPTRIALDLETADSLAAFGASMDELREGLEHMQRTLDIVSPHPTQTGIHSPIIAADSGTSPAVFPHLIELSNARSPEAESTRRSERTMLHIETSELPQTSRHGAVSDSAGSSDLEPDSLHSRKRRRLN